MKPGLYILLPKLARSLPKFAKILPKFAKWFWIYFFMIFSTVSFSIKREQREQRDVKDERKKK